MSARGRGRGGRGRGRGGRGRGRSGVRGRGNSRGRRGRGQGRFGTIRRRTESLVNDIVTDSEPTMDNVKSYFMGNVSFEQHYQAQEENRDRYAAAVATMIENGVDIVQSK